MRIEWNKKTEQQWHSIAATLHKTFGKDAVLDFAQNVNEWQRRIILNPEIASFEPLLKDRRKPYRSIVIHKCCKLVYYVNQKEEVVRIVALWDTRRDPTGLAARI